MQWVTREHPRTDRIACPWLIRKFIDPEAEIVYVPRDDVLDYAERESAISFDTPGAKYTHRDGKCSFETLVEEYGITDPAKLDLRCPTFAVRIANHTPLQLATSLGERGFFTWDGNYYALNLSERLDVEKDGGFLRIGLAHYNAAEEVTRLLTALREIALREPTTDH